MKHIESERGESATPWQHAVEDVVSALARTAVARDQQGGTAQAERDLLRASGLLALSVPRELGGLGADWQQTLDVVRRFARLDSSVAHLFAFHHLMLATIRLFGQCSQWQPWTEQTLAERWFWGNALNPLDKSTLAEPQADGGHVFTGRKSFAGSMVPAF